MVRPLTNSLEDYLEAIYVLDQQKERVRVKHIADFLGVSRPSVVSAVTALGVRGLVQHAPYADVRLTPEGRQRGEAIYGRHVMLRRFLEELLGLPRELAERDACRLEHLLAQQSLERIAAFLTFLEGSPDARRLIARFQAGLDATSP